MNMLLVLVLTSCAMGGCAPSSPAPAPATNAYLDYSGRDDKLTGGVKMIPITTPKGTFRVWTRRCRRRSSSSRRQGSTRTRATWRC